LEFSKLIFFAFSPTKIFGEAAAPTSAKSEARGAKREPDIFSINLARKTEAPQTHTPDPT
jgi:hypothetical protein